MSTLPEPVTGSILLLLAPRSYLRQALPHLVARMAVSGPLTVVDGGNLFDVYSISRHVRRSSDEVYPLLDRIHLARAFTCYQVVSLLASLAPSKNEPILCLDLLSTFQDESVSQYERRRLLQQAIAYLRRFTVSAPVAVSAVPPPPDQPEEWIDRLVAVAEKVWRLETLPRPFTPPMF